MQTDFKIRTLIKQLLTKALFKRNWNLFDQLLLTYKIYGRDI